MILSLRLKLFAVRCNISPKLSFLYIWFHLVYRYNLSLSNISFRLTIIFALLSSSLSMCVEATWFSILQSDFYLKLFFQFKVFTVFIFLVWFFSPLKQLNQFKDLAGFSYFYWLGVQKQWTFLILRGPDFVYISFPAFLLRNQTTFIWNHHLHVISCQHNHLKLFKILNFSTSLSLKATHPFF